MSRTRRNQRILVIDQTQPILEFMDMLLRAEGYEVVAAPSLEGARRRLAGARPDLVICDPRAAGAPVLPTLELLESDEVTRDVPLLLCTCGISDVDASPERVLRPVTEILLKPFDIDDLLNATERLACSLPAQRTGA